MSFSQRASKASQFVQNVSHCSCQNTVAFAAETRILAISDATWFASLELPASGALRIGSLEKGFDSL